MRIEQNPDGTYGKRMTDVEQRTLKLIYKEQGDRAVQDAFLQAQIDQLSVTIISLTNDLSNTKIKLAQVTSAQAKDASDILLLQTQLQQLTKQLQQANVI